MAGLFSDPSMPPSEALAKAGGSISGGNANIAFGPYGLTAAIAIHETMHDTAKNGYGHDHFQMVQAASNSANAMGLTVLAKFPQAGDYKTGGGISTGPVLGILAKPYLMLV